MNRSPALIDQARTRSLELFGAGFNCAESVLLGVSETLGYATGSLPQIATGFGSGVARYGEICGALTGAVMAIGLAQGRKNSEDVEARERTYQSVDVLLKEFHRVHGSLTCLELTGCDMRTEEGRKKAGQLDLHKQHCPKFVALAAELAAREIG
jgi:C_GCAxxG_C_C family probable redox protein